jgi:hypothetical protein
MWKQEDKPQQMYHFAQYLQLDNNYHCFQIVCNLIDMFVKVGSQDSWPLNKYWYQMLSACSAMLWEALRINYLYR